MSRDNKIVTKISGLIIVQIFHQLIVKFHLFVSGALYSYRSVCALLDFSKLSFHVTGLFNDHSNRI